MKEWLHIKVSLFLTVALVLAAAGATWLVARPDQPIPFEAPTVEGQYKHAVKDAMTVEEDELLPLVSLAEGDKFAVHDDEGRVLLLTYHRHPQSYPKGAEVVTEWGDVWTVTVGELAAWYDENHSDIREWPARLRQLFGLPPDNEASHFTAMWVKPEDIKRPAYVQSIGEVAMTDHFADTVDATFKEWFDDNIVRSYFDEAYPWTRLGYTYDWASDAPDEYGLSEFLVAENSTVKVAYTVNLAEMLKMLDSGNWLPKDAAVVEMD